jgi:hypothetical protein
MEVTPLIPTTRDFSVKCRPPSIEKNIVGDWRFESTYNENPGSITKGSIMFDKDGNITDPDFLFSYILAGTDAVISKKTYNPKVLHTEASLKGEFFEVYLDTKYGVSTHYFSLASNECNKIHLRQFRSKDNAIGFILTRK